MDARRKLGRLWDLMGTTNYDLPNAVLRTNAHWERQEHRETLSEGPSHCLPAQGDP